MNTRVNCIARRQARIGGFTAPPSLSPSLEASEDEDPDDGSNDNDEDEDKDENEDASSSSDEEMTTS